VYAHADYVAVNISSPNTKNLRQLQGDEALDALLSALQARRGELARQQGRQVPMFVKIAPDLDEAQVGAVAATLRRNGIDGVIATNTTIAATPCKGSWHADETGGLSGGPCSRPATASCGCCARPSVPASRSSASAAC